MYNNLHELLEYFVPKNVGIRKKSNPLIKSVIFVDK